VSNRRQTDAAEFRPKFIRQQDWVTVKPCIGKEVQARVSAVIGRRKKERENTTCCVCERDIVACIEKMAAAPIQPAYSGYLSYFICASLPVKGSRLRYTVT